MIWLRFLDAIEAEPRAINMAAIACMEEGTGVLRFVLTTGEQFHAVTNLAALFQRIEAAMQAQRGSLIIIVEVD